MRVLVEEQKDNKEMVITYLNAGEFFGEMGLFEDGVRSAWIKAKLIVRSVTPSLES